MKLKAAVVLLAAAGFVPLAAVSTAQTPSLKYGDGQPDGKQSLGGSGEIVGFTLPAEDSKVGGIRIHGSRYGMSEAPSESFLIYFLSHDMSEVIRTEMARLIPSLSAVPRSGWK
jgi:hypothetical protein